MGFTEENANAIIGGNTQTFDFEKPEMFCWITEDAIISGYTLGDRNAEYLFMAYSINNVSV